MQVSLARSACEVDRKATSSHTVQPPKDWTWTRSASTCWPSHTCRDVHDLHASTIATDQPVLTAHVVLDDECFTDGHAAEMLAQLQDCVGIAAPDAGRASRAAAALIA